MPRYDFNWQNAYILKTPKLLPRNTTIMCDGVFDNSARNLANPDPKREVPWGDQTFDEMMLGSFVISLPDSAVVGEFPKVTDLGDNQFQVEFRYRPEGDPKNVKSVSLAGSFNEWKPTAQAMQGPDPEGWYRATLRLPVGQHEYKFVVNGNYWKHDPDNPNQNGPFSNSVVRIRRTKK